MDWRQRHWLELRQLGVNDPPKLIALYRRVLGLDEVHPLPDDVSIDQVIESVLLSQSVRRSSNGQAE